MSNAAWSWFKKAAHYMGVGITDVNKFLQTSGALNLISLFPAGGAVAGGIGVFEKVMGTAAQVEKTAAIFVDPSIPSGPAKLEAATPTAISELLQLAATAGMKVTDNAKLGTIAAALTSAAADFWNIVEPINVVALPTPPAINVKPVSATGAPIAGKQA